MILYQILILFYAMDIGVLIRYIDFARYKHGFMSFFELYLGSLLMCGSHTVFVRYKRVIILLT